MLSSGCSHNLGYGMHSMQEFSSKTAHALLCSQLNQLQSGKYVGRVDFSLDDLEKERLFSENMYSKNIHNAKKFEKNRENLKKSVKIQ